MQGNPLHLPMDQQLIGYLLNALDAPERKSVDEYLRQSVDARKRLALLRRAVEPLDYDCEDPVPPPMLVTDTLKKIAKYKCRPLEPMPAPRDRGSYRPIWRRADVLVAACILVILLSMLPVGLQYLRHRERVLACGDNLRQFHTAFVQYSRDDRFRGRLPAPAPRGPMAFAGSYASQLRDAGYWHPDLRLTCPFNAKDAKERACMPPTCAELGPACSAARRRPIGGCYGYSLGFEPESGPYRGLAIGDGDHLGLMADQPPRPGEPFRNSPNHGGEGQSVLYLGGHVRYEGLRELDGDDLFTNRWGHMAAGKGLGDTVIGYSEAEPFPAPREDK